MLLQSLYDQSPPVKIYQSFVPNRVVLLGTDRVVLSQAVVFLKKVSVHHKICSIMADETFTVRNKLVKLLDGFPLTDDILKLLSIFK